MPRPVLHFRDDDGVWQRIAVGPKGDKGDKGDTGTMSVGTVTTGAAGSAATITNSGTPEAGVFDFTIPQGIKGDTGTLTVGGVTTGAPGSSATVVNSGTASAAVLNFTIPRGDVGPQGVQGVQGIQGVPGSRWHTGSGLPAAGLGAVTDWYLNTDSSDVYEKTGASTWVYRTNIKGATGTLSLGTVATGNPGTNVVITNTGTATAGVFNFTIPRGDVGPQGPSGTMTVGSVTTGAAGSSATVTNSGTATSAIWNFTIPQGIQGLKGDKGDTGTLSVGTVTTGAVGSNATVTNTGTATAAVLNFSFPRGAGVQVGGLTGQYLRKNSNADFDTGWVDVPAPTNMVTTDTAQDIISTKTFVASTATANPLLVRGAASQTGDLQQWQNSTGTMIARVRSDGLIQSTIGFGAGGTGPTMVPSTTDIMFTSGAAANVPVRVRGTTSQTGNLQEWQNVGGTVLTRVDSAGSFITANAIYAPGLANGSTSNNSYVQMNTGGTLVTTAVAANVGLTVRNTHATPTGDLTQWLDTAGAVIARVRLNGEIGTSTVDGLAQNGSYVTLVGSGSVLIRNRAATHVPLAVRGFTSQSANLQEWQDTGGATLARVDAAGNIVTTARVLAGASATPGQLASTSSAASTITFVARGAASQTANLTEWQNDAGTVLSRVAADGSILAGGNSQLNQIGVGGTGLSGVRLVSFAATATVVPLVARGAASQTGDLQQWQDSAGTSIARVDSTGAIRMTSNSYGFHYNDAGSLAGRLSIYLDSPSVVGTIVRGIASQTADLSQWQDSAGTILARVDASGFIYEGVNRVYSAGNPQPMTGYATTAEVDTRINAIIDAAPGTLDTLNELAAALGDDPNFATTVTNNINTRALDTTVVHLAGSETVSGGKTFTAAPIFNVGGAAINLRTDASADHVYMSFFARSATPTTRSAYLGFPSAASTVLTINNELNGGITLTGGNVTVASGGQLFEGANRVYSAGNKVPIAGLSATGTASATTYLRGDNTWSALPVMSAANTTFAPTGTISSTNVQAAIQELNAEKVTPSVGATLPAVAGRTAGDTHFDTATGFTYFVSGAGGTGGTPISDSFSGVSGDGLSGIWTPRLGTMRYHASGYAHGTAASGAAVYAVYTVTTDNANGQLNSTAIAAGGSGYLVARFQDINNFYFADFVNKRLCRYVNGSITSLGTWTASPGVGGTQAFSFQGSTLAVYVAGTQVLSLTDTTFGSGTIHGIGANGSGDGMDDFSYGASQGTLAWNLIKSTLPSNGVTLDTAQTITAVKTFSAAPIVPDASFTLAKISATGTRDATTFLRGDGTFAAPPASPVLSVNTRTGAVTGLAEDNAVVHLAGAETISGAKTFSNTPVISNTSPTLRFHDTDQATGISNAWWHLNSGTFYLLMDTNNDGAWEGVYPITVTSGAVSTGISLQDRGNWVYSAINPPVQGIPFHMGGTVGTGLKPAKFIAPGAMTLRSSRGHVDTSSACTYSVFVNGARVAGPVGVGVGSAAALHSDWADVNINANDKVQIFVDTANADTTELAVTIEAVTR